MPLPDAALDVLQEAAGASEAPAAVSAPAIEENASAVSPPQPDATPGDRPATDAEPAAEPAEMPVAQPTRSSILAAFNRNRTPPQPTPPQPRPPERRVERQAQPASLSEDAVDELIAGWQAGNLAWPRKLLGEEPGHPGCRLSREALRRNGLA